MIERRTGEALHGVDDGGHRQFDVFELRQVGAQHDFARQHPRRRLAEHRDVGVAPDPGGVLAHDRVGEGVVGRDPRADQQLLRGARSRGTHIGAVLGGQPIEHLRPHTRPHSGVCGADAGEGP